MRMDLLFRSDIHTLYSGSRSSNRTDYSKVKNHFPGLISLPNPNHVGVNLIETLGICHDKGSMKQIKKIDPDMIRVKDYSSEPDQFLLKLCQI